MEEKDKIIQLDDFDDPMDEHIIELNDEVSESPEDEKTVDLSELDDTTPTEDENILDLTETADAPSDENDGIIDLTDSAKDDEKQEEKVLELDDFAEATSLEEEMLDNDVATIPEGHC